MKKSSTPPYPRPVSPEPAHSSLLGALPKHHKLARNPRFSCVVLRGVLDGGRLVCPPLSSRAPFRSVPN